MRKPKLDPLSFDRGRGPPRASLTGGGPPPGQAAPRGTPVSRGRAWNLRSEPLAWVVLALGIIASGSAASAAVPEYSAVVVRTYPHDPGAFTEGLLYQDGFLYESTGLAGRSSIRKVDLATGTVLHQRAIDPKYFGEGIVIWKDRLIELTWQDKIGFVYELDSFKPVSQFHYAGEGWALTRSDHQLIMSDGTSDLRLFDPDRLTETGRIHVTCDSRPIHNINELEWVKGEIYANVWLTSLIIRIDPATGAVVGVIDLKDLTPPSAKGDADDVLNGIAYDAAADRLFVTGKRWPVLYQISLRPLAAGPSSCMSLP